MMKIQYKTMALLVAALALAASLCACAANPVAGATEIIDGAGRTVSVNLPAKKIVAMVPADVEVLYALGAQESIVAVGEYCNYPAEALELPGIGTGINTSVEQLIALQPDLVIMGKMAQDVQQTEALEAAGIPVVVTDPQSIADTYANIEMLGKLTGKTVEAEALVADMKAGFDAIASGIPENDKKRVYVEVSPLEYGLFTCGMNTFIDELLSHAGFYNVFSDLEGWPAISEEQVIARNPDVIFTTSDGVFGPSDPVAEICERNGWDTVSAVSGGEVFLIDPDMCTRPGPRLVDAARAMAQAAYGQR